MLREEKNKSEATKKFQNRQCWKESTNILSTKQRYSGGTQQKNQVLFKLFQVNLVIHTRLMVYLYYSESEMLSIEVF